MKNLFVLIGTFFLVTSCNKAEDDSDSKGINLRGSSNAKYTSKNNRAFVHSRMTEINEAVRKTQESRFYSIMR